ncbi:hypothetical protein FQN54_004193 [Arachnomyces sp. PD_36]|nr:hypothetical protein FQN54_004193 [Arachnomyces sp. PD_36]
MPSGQKRRRAANDDNSPPSSSSENENENTNENASNPPNQAQAQARRRNKRQRNSLFASLEPQIRHVSQHTVKTKWVTLPEQVQDRVQELFRSVERPVITRQRDERKRIEAQTAVGSVIRNLRRRLPRMPFPPMTKDAAFDYESALGEQRALGAQLTTVTNSVDLLKAEIAREEKELAREKALLEDMEKNAKMAETARRRQVKNDHPMLRHLEQVSFQQQKQEPPGFDIRDMKTCDVGLSDIGDDPDLLPLVKQLRSHLESMQSNALQTSGIRDAIMQSQAALDLVHP